MDITHVRVFPVEEEKLKAFVSIVIDECFVVSDIKIIEGANGLFISMPSKKRKNGTFRDIAHPLNNETRRRIEEQIIDRYKDVVSEGGNSDATPLRELGQEAADDARRAIAALAVDTRPEPAQSGDTLDAFGNGASRTQPTEAMDTFPQAPSPESNEDEETEEGSWP